MHASGVTPAAVPKLKVAELREALARLGAPTDGASLPPRQKSAPRMPSSNRRCR